MVMSQEKTPMKLFRAVYRKSDQSEHNLDLYARNLSAATLSAAELIPQDASLLHVFHNPDW